MGTTPNYALRYPASSAAVIPYQHIQDLATDVDTTLDTYFGVVKRARRVTNTATTTGELGALRLDSIPIKAGYFYKICTSPLFVVGTATADVNGVSLRASTSGVATTASGQLTQVQMPCGSTLHPPGFPSIVLPYISAVDQTLSVLLSVLRGTSGTGTASLQVNTTFPSVDLWVECRGLDTGDTGVVL